MCLTFPKFSAACFIQIFLRFRFRHYYQHVVFLKWMKAGPNLNSVGLILASTFGLEVATHLAYGVNGANPNLPRTDTDIINTVQTSEYHKNDEIQKASPKPKIVIADPSTNNQDSTIRLLQNGLTPSFWPKVRIVYTSVCFSKKI